MGVIKVGTCGFGYYKPREGWKERYVSRLQAFSARLETLEVNRTFYSLPMLKTAERWRGEALEGFEFTVKAWQAITHPTDSPTWRKRKNRLTERQKKNFGYLRPNREILDAWEQTKEVSEALGAKVCVLQTPASFRCTKEHERNMREFLNRIDRGRIRLAWEPRGEWNIYPAKIRQICNNLGLIHIVDLMRREPLSDHPAAYIRLHGLNPKEYDYNYAYSATELRQLANKLKQLSEGYEVLYCMFNNDAMYADAKKLLKML
jgi:uncharacterized protein YecE (DUF72 family)